MMERPVSNIEQVRAYITAEIRNHEEARRDIDDSEEEWWLHKAVIDALRGVLDVLDKPLTLMETLKLSLRA